MLMSLIVFQFLLQIIWILRILYQVIDSKIPVVNLDSSLCAGFQDFCATLNSP